MKFQQKLFKIVRKGSKTPLWCETRSGVFYNNRWSDIHRQIFVFGERQWLDAWQEFTDNADRYNFKDYQLLFDNKVIAEAFINPKPKDDWDIFRIRVLPSAPAELKKFLIIACKNGHKHVRSMFD